MTKIKSVWIIDDDEIAVFGMKRSMLKLNLYDQLTIFHDGLSALEALENTAKQKENMPDVIFLDLNMPVMDGWEFIEEFRSATYYDHIKPAIFIMTSSIDLADNEKAKHYNLEANYIVKPMSVEVLMGILDAHS